MPRNPRTWVVCLCAEWCGVCRDWRAAFRDQARAHPDLHFAWVDVEDEADALGEVDIETFPTVLVARDGKVLFLGPVLPSTGGLARVLATLRTQPQPYRGLPADADVLFRRLAEHVLPHSAI